MCQKPNGKVLNIPQLTISVTLKAENFEYAQSADRPKPTLKHWYDIFNVFPVTWSDSYTHSQQLHTSLCIYLLNLSTFIHITHGYLSGKLGTYVSVQR